MAIRIPKYESWDALKSDCQNCARCALAAGRTQVVFGHGDFESEVMLIGEAPGAEEDKTGMPFAGRSGALLDVMLASIGVKREQVFITNIVKCRPPENRDPLNIESDECIGWLKAQTRLIKPKIIVCLGRVAAVKIIKPDYKITAEHGTWTHKNDTWLTAIFHPAYLLRDPRKKPEAFASLKSLERKMLEVCTRTMPE